MEIVAACERYKAFADWVVIQAGGSDKLVHLNVGLLLWVVAALVLRRPLRSFAPLLSVTLIQITNEVIDYSVRAGWTWQDSVLDTLATLGWPCLLWLVLAIAAKGSPPARPRLAR
jgi:hypothetical protein